MSTRMFGWTLASVLACGALVSPLAADEIETKAAIAKLLEVGWATTPQARTAADLQYQEVQKVAAGNKDALLASALVLMQQRRYDEAHKRVDELLVKDITDLTALRARIWVLAVLKNYSTSMFTADKLSERLAAHPPKTAAEQALHEELQAFLGRMFGYFGGPAAEVANQDERKKYEKLIVARLEESKRPIFDEARDGVLQKFIELTDSQADTRDKAIADAAAAKEKTLQELESGRLKDAARVDELKEERSKIESEFQAELAEIAKLDQPLVQQLSRLSAQAAALNQNLINFDADIDRLQRLASQTKDPVLKNQYLFDAEQVSRAAGRVQADLIGVERLANNVQGQRAALAARQQRAQQAVNDRLGRMNQELGEIAKREKRNDGIEKRASQPASGTTSKGRSLSAQATALSTYDQFPLEIARQKLLEALR